MNTTITQWPETISGRKRDSIIQLIFQNIENDEEREQYLDELETASEYDANEILKSLLSA
ncbi:MAG: hypothetical protein Q7S04_01405 [Candidatus Moranbacteria bacterium]|nr:hypothetical protein [Candidatus Moranbacteria bacterium]